MKFAWKSSASSRYIAISSILFGVLFTAWSSEASAQRARYKPQTHELSLQLASTHGIPGETMDTDGGYPFGAEFVSGLQYTYHYSLSDGFRLGVQRRNGTFSEMTSADEPITLEKQNWDVNLGYERKIHFGPAQFYGGADLQFSRQNLEYRFGQNTADPSIGTVGSNHVGISGFGGIGYFFSPYLSLSAEAKVGYLSQVSEDNSKGELPVPFLENGEIFAQASVSLNIHLVKMKKRCTCPKFRR